MKRFIFAIIAALLAVQYTAIAKEEVCFYVSPDGSDYNNGTYSEPYKTLYRAREAARYLRESGKNTQGSIKIILKEGTYFLNDSFYLDSRDFNLIFEGKGNCVISGGIEFDSNEAQNVIDWNIYRRLPKESRDYVKCIDLQDFFRQMDNPPEVNGMNIELSDYLVSFNNKQMINARYPNDETMNVDTIYKSGKEGGDSFIIGYSDDNISSWQNPQEIYVEGYGDVGWKYQKIRLDSIDSENKIITSTETKLYSGIYDNAKIWFSNVLEELDEEGEWYIDRENKKIYFYPPHNSGTIEIAVMKKPLIRCVNTKNISFVGITFKNTRTQGIETVGSEGIVLDSCIITNTGKEGAEFRDCKNSGVKNSNIVETGCGGVTISGGDKYDLEESANFAINNEICDFSKVKTTYSPAVNVSGIGDIVSYNTIHESYHAAIIFSGNDNEISHNEIYNVLLGTTDAGAIYIYGDASARGNIIENNFIHHLGNGDRTFEGEGIFAVYFDNFNSGQTVRNNIFYDMPCSIHINGGGYNTIENNVFGYVDVPVYAHSFETFPSIDSWNSYLKLNKDEKIWIARYPELAFIPDPLKPADTYCQNAFSNNIIGMYSDVYSKIDTKGCTVINNELFETDIFTDRSNFDFSITVESSSFVPFDYSDVGIR